MRSQKRRPDVSMDGYCTRKASATRLTTAAGSGNTQRHDIAQSPDVVVRSDDTVAGWRAANARDRPRSRRRQLGVVATVDGGGGFRWSEMRSRVWLCTGTCTDKLYP